MTVPLVLGDVTVDVAGRALLVVPVAAVAGPDGTASLAAASAAGIDVLELDVLEVDGGDGDGGPVPAADAVGGWVDAVRQAARLPVVVRTARPDVVAAVAAAGGAGLDVREAWALPGLLDEVARSGLVVVVAGRRGADAAAAAGIRPDRLVVEPGVTPVSGRRPVSAWSVDPARATGPGALAEAAVAIVRGMRWLRVPAPDGFRQVRDTLAAVEAAVVAEAAGAAGGTGARVTG